MTLRPKFQRTEGLPEEGKTTLQQEERILRYKVVRIGVNCHLMQKIDWGAARILDQSGSQFSALYWRSSFVLRLVSVLRSRPLPSHQRVSLCKK
jgi:hypothetical protein